MNSAESQKILKPCTIIPLALYVEREADRQLAANVRDMGRPGYVLVARQMGKTNLLIHAKRTIEQQDVRFVYVDLSVASYHDERECFRHIIDTAIDSHRDIFEEAEKIILDKRNQLRPPNREHDTELRVLLANAKTKLIIILDEIDSLVNAEFSDRVFAHIRSVYFSRINYPDLGRLGYILSGVVEPNEIIKDKKISPFNIGEKIYLDDFSASELRQFVDQAKLQMSEAAIERLTHWTGGNPRMLWDLCAELEDRLTIEGLALSPSLIDETVGRYYLNNFDHAPVDHIRELVRENADVRSAVSTLIKGESFDLSDSVRTKLYLFGITKAGSSDQVPKIKNEVIVRSLSLEWIKSLTSDLRLILSQADEQFARNRYDRALQCYSDYLEGGEDPQLITAAWFQSGMCHYHLGNFSAALRCFGKASDLTIPQNLATRDMFMGICNFFLEQFDDSINQLKSALSRNSSAEFKSRIELNLGSALLGRGQPDDAQEVEEIFTKITTEFVASDAESRKQNTHLATIAFYNLGTVHQRKNDYAKAAQALESALDIADLIAKPTLHIRLAELDVRKEKQDVNIACAVNGTIKNNILPVENHPENPLALSRDHAFDLLTLLVNNGREDLLELFLKHLESNSSEKNARFLWLRDAGQSALSKNKPSNAIALLKRALQVEVADYSAKIDCISWLLLVDSDPELEREYLTLLDSVQIRPRLSLLDVRNLAHLARNLLNEKRWNEALNVVRKTARFRDEIDPALLRNYLGFDFVEMTCLENLKERSSLVQIANRALKLAENLPEARDKKQIFFSEEELKMAIETASHHLTFSQLRLQIPTPKIKIPNMRRNDNVSVKYRDGRKVENVKYKRIERDLRAGFCQII